MTSQAVRFYPGLSLKHAYQPASYEDLIDNYNNHACLACKTISPSQELPEIVRETLDNLVFFVAQKPCTCGYTNDIFIILNDWLRQEDETIASSQQAIAQAQRNPQFPDSILEEQLSWSTAAIHRGDFDEAIRISRELTERYPKLFIPWFNLGIIYAQQQQYSDSLQAYDIALQLNPDYDNTLANKARVLMQLSRYREAGELYERWRERNPDGTAILAQEDGKFGKVRILDNQETRSLCIDDQVQGRVFKQPNSQYWEPDCRLGPGALSDNMFAAGVLLLGYRVRRGTGLVLGLGCGAGIAMNLACFPDLKITVVEVDPVAIRLCLTFFPLMQHYVDIGRLEIIEADANTFLQTSDRTFDFVRFDVYSGRSELPTQLSSVPYIQQMKAIAPIVFANAIASLNDPNFKSVIDAFESACGTMAWIYPSKDISTHPNELMNWSIFNCEVTIPDGFVPFPTLSGTAVDRFRERFFGVYNRKTSRDRLYLDA